MGLSHALSVLAATMIWVAANGIPGTSSSVLEAQACQPAILSRASVVRVGPDEGTFRVQITGYCAWDVDAVAAPWLTIPFVYSGAPSGPPPAYWGLVDIQVAANTSGAATKTLIVDPLGTVTYDLFRSDVAALFPGLANSGGAVDYRPLDTTRLAEGVHTVEWGVTDNGGAAAGIGSRYFTVANSADAVPPAALASGPESGRQSASVSGMDGDALEEVRITPLQRLAISVADPRDAECDVSYVAYLDANGELRDLPAGVTLERRGLLRWQPGPAFRGRYDFRVIRTACDGVRTARRVSVTVRPLNP